MWFYPGLPNLLIHPAMPRTPPQLGALAAVLLGQLRKGLHDLARLLHGLAHDLGVCRSVEGTWTLQSPLENGLNFWGEIRFLTGSCIQGLRCSFWARAPGPHGGVSRRCLSGWRFPTFQGFPLSQTDSHGKASNPNPSAHGWTTQLELDSLFAPHICFGQFCLNHSSK